MKKILFMVLFSILFSTAYAEEFIVTQYIKPNGNIVVNQVSKDGTYSYSREFIPGEKIVMPTERIEMTDKEINDLRSTSADMTEWKKSHQCVDV